MRCVFSTASGRGGEERAHLGLALQVELLRLGKRRRSGLVERLPGLDAQQHVLIVGVLFFNIVYVVRRREGDARLAVDAQQRRGTARAPRRSCGGSAAQGRSSPHRRAACSSMARALAAVIISRAAAARGMSPATQAAQADETVCMFCCSSGQVDARLAVKARARTAADTR